MYNYLNKYLNRTYPISINYLVDVVVCDYSVINLKFYYTRILIFLYK